jgi:AbrB family looped-hinge helix DNA binding protein
MEELTVNEKGLILIPARMRRELDIKPGSTVIAVVEGPRIVIWKKPSSFTDYMTGLHAEVWEGVDAEEYVEEERRSWEDRPGGS